MKESPPIAKKPLVSVVVCSFRNDRFHDLVRLLHSLEIQSYRNFETIVVLEKSRAQVRRLKNHVKSREYPNTRIVFSYDYRDISSVRDIGLKLASGKIVSFIDDDIPASSVWLEEMVRNHSSPDGRPASSGEAVGRAPGK